MGIPVLIRATAESVDQWRNGTCKEASDCWRLLTIRFGLAEAVHPGWWGSNRLLWLLGRGWRRSVLRKSGRQTGPN